MRPDQPPTSLNHLFADHSRHWSGNLYVYPVISRRSGGLSIGINLNPDKACNFDCVYCQVDRSVPPAVRKVDLDRLSQELDQMIQLAVDGELFAGGPLATTPHSHRSIRDIAFSGDGEPTASPVFLEAVELAAGLRGRHNLDDVKLRVITDAAYLNRPRVRKALAILDANNGEIWAKLDAGTDERFRLINRANMPLQTILDNICDAARVRPVVIQSLWMRIHGQAPPATEIDAFADRLKTILDQGGRFSLIQIYTVARQTAEQYVSPLPDGELNTIADRVRARIAAPVAVFGG
ncbi:MAG TPA: radical SAM protein [Phycisphaerae bacterium]|nr:radical SAM protein [Phycisphaerae bacterium]HRY68227.1 radical SAM protein [Phycisphaerae bacterium]HSA28589.1 radical SAM protein [Phycisphaerae bacterium]